MNIPVNVLVTGVGGGGLGEQLVKALRLAETPYNIIGTDISPVSFGLMQVDRPFLLPRADAPSYLPALRALCEAQGVRALFCGSEPELRVVSGNRTLFEDLGILLPFNPDSVIRTCLDKLATARFLADRGFACPRTLEIASLDDLTKVDFLPVILKPLSGAGSANVFIAQTQDDLESLGKHLLTYHTQILAQEYVGTADGEFTVGVLLSMEGKLINSVAIQRNILSGLGSRIRLPNRTGRADLGASLVVSSGISQGYLDVFPEVTRPCEEIALALGCRGAVNIQCRLVAGKPLVFEINPRFSGTTSLRALAGYNEPDILIRKHVLNQSIECRFPYRSGHILRGLNERFVETEAIPSATNLVRHG